MISRLKNLIRWAKIGKSGTDDKQFPVQQVTYLGKTGNAMMVFPFGYHANLTPDALGLLFSIAGNEENRAFIGATPQNRPQLAAGEVVVYHPDSGSQVLFKASGDIEVTTATNVKVTAGQSVTIDSPQATFTGDVQIDGALNVTGAGSIGGKDFATHVHVGSPTAPTGPQTNTGGVV